MKYGPVVFLIAFSALAASWFGLVLTPQVQLGRLQQGTNTINTSELYPQARPGVAQQGAEVYRANNCAACHSQQVRQSGTAMEVVLTETGTNLSALDSVLKNLNANVAGVAGALPKILLTNAPLAAAELLVKFLTAAGAKAEAHVIPAGPDIPRWGPRRTVAVDFIFDQPVMLGSLRIGPDLANVGLRKLDPNWHYQHLYAPRSNVPGSIMPPYRFLFEKRKIQREPSPDALQLPPESAPAPGFEIVPKPEAKQLVAYLLSLRADAPLFEAPLTIAAKPKPDSATNSPAK
jgi:cbb3-type cytochrome oxidase cytochrome c subunit